MQTIFTDYWGEFRNFVGVAVVAFKDRLTRFGFRYLERYFSSHGVGVEAVNGEEPKGRLPRTSRGLDSLSI
jgi:hypothetical protein